MRHGCAIAALFIAGCASVPVDLNNGGIPLAKSGWQMSGGADFDKKIWFVCFWRPWGDAENNAVAAADKVVLP